MKFLFALKLILASLFLTSFHLPAEEQANLNSAETLNSRALKIVAVTNANPYALMLPDGTITGLYVDFWNLWAETNHHPVSFSMANFSDSIDLVQNAEAVHIGLFRNAERETWADFSLPLFTIETGVIFGRNYSGYEDLSEGAELSVGVLNESYQAGYLTENYPFLNLYLYSEVDAAIPKLLSGELDAIVAEVPILNVTLDKHGLNGVLRVADKTILKNDVHAVIAKGAPELLALIDKGIENIPVKSLIALFNKWLPNQEPSFSAFPELTVAERNWLRTLPALDIGLAINSYPFGFLDEKSRQIGGIVPDYINHISETLNISLQPEYKTSWSESFDALKEGELDVLADIVNTPQRSNSLEFTTPYFVADNVIVALEQNFQFNSLRNMDDKTVGILPGYEVELINRDYPNVNLKLVESVLDGLHKVESKEIDVFVGPISVINFEIYKQRINNLRITAFLPYKLELSMTVRKGMEPLIPIMNKVLSSMSEKQKAAINNKWMPVYVRTGVDVKTVLTWILPIAILILTITLLVILNINHRLKKEVSIRKKAEQEANTANMAKSEFLSRMSHELRTPMNAILGFSQLLESSEEISVEDRESVSEVQKAGYHLLGLINEVLDLAKIEAGKLSISLEPVNLNVLIDECTQLVSPLASKRGITIKVNLKKSVGVIADNTRLKQCLLNLLSNAIKYNDREGEVVINVNACPQDKLTKIEIKDNGRGISQDEQAKLFQPFERLGEERYLTEGTGIGLTITKRLVSLMNGEIGAKSELGLGSTFYIMLPNVSLDESLSSSESQPQELPRKALRSQASHLILYIDDSPPNIRLMERMLSKREDIKLLSALEPELGIDMIATCEPDLILLDITMPVMDGYDVLKKLQEIHGASLVPVIAVTANAMEQDSKRGLAAGFAEYIAKPFDIANFYNVIDKHLNAIKSNAVNTFDTAAPDIKGK